MQMIKKILFFILLFSACLAQAREKLAIVAGGSCEDAKFAPSKVIGLAGKSSRKVFNQGFDGIADLSRELSKKDWKVYANFSTDNSSLYDCRETCAEKDLNCKVCPESMDSRYWTHESFHKASQIPKDEIKTNTFKNFIDRLENISNEATLEDPPQVLISFITHGIKAGDKGIKEHSLCFSKPGGGYELISVNNPDLQNALKKLKDKKAELGIIDGSCYGGGSLPYLSQYGCVLSSQSADAPAIMNGVNAKLVEMLQAEKGKFNLDDVFMKTLVQEKEESLNIYQHYGGNQYKTDVPENQPFSSDYFNQTELSALGSLTSIQFNLLENNDPSLSKCQASVSQLQNVENFLNLKVFDSLSDQSTKNELEKLGIRGELDFQRLAKQTREDVEKMKLLVIENTHDRLEIATIEEAKTNLPPLQNCEEFNNESFDRIVGQTNFITKGDFADTDNKLIKEKVSEILNGIYRFNYPTSDISKDNLFRVMNEKDYVNQRVRDIVSGEIQSIKSNLKSSDKHSAKLEKKIIETVGKQIDDFRKNVLKKMGGEEKFALYIQDAKKLSEREDQLYNRLRTIEEEGNVIKTRVGSSISKMRFIENRKAPPVSGNCKNFSL